MQKPSVGTFEAGDELQHPHRVDGRIGHRDDLHDVGVELCQPLVDLFEVLGRLLEVVVADDPLRVAVAADAAGDVGLEVDVVGPAGDGGAEQGLPLFLAAAPASLLLCPAAGADDGSGPLGQQDMQVGRVVEPIEPQFDELGPAPASARCSATTIL